MKDKTKWKIFWTIVLVLAALSFTPLVIPYGTSEPFLLGLPRTLWAGMLISILIYIVLIMVMITSKDEG